MTILGLDISVYQEQTAFGKFIDWVILKNNNPNYNFRFIWIKIAEGVGLGNYPITDVKRQVIGAQSVNFDIINGYHFYYFQWFSTVANRWYTLSSIDQAKTFYDAYNQSGMTVRHPMTDIEDPFVGQFLSWTDTTTANAALAFARKLNAHLKTYHLEIYRLFGIRPDIYTGAWWWDRMASLLVNNGYASELDWTKDFKFVLADYVGGLDYPIGVTPQQTIAWQKTSSPVPYVKGIPTGRVTAGDALDIDQWMQSDLEYNLWAGLDNGGTMAGTYVTTTPEENRATMILLSAEDQNVDMSAIDTDAVILSMLSTVETHLEVDTEFKARALVTTQKPVLGFVGLDAHYLVEWSLPNVENELWYNSKFLKALLNQWRKAQNQIPEIEWTNQKLNITATDGKWLPLNGIVFNIWNTVNITGLWQLATLKYAIKYLRIFMDGGFIPKVPMFFLASSDFFKQYDANADWKPGLLGLLNNKDLTGIGMLEVGAYPEVPMAAPFNTIKEIFAYRPSNTYIYKYIPYGFENAIYFHLYSQNRFMAKPINSGLSTISVAVWCDTKEEMNETLNFKQIIPPPPPPPPVTDPTLKELSDKIKVIEDKLAAIKALL